MALPDRISEIIALELAKMPAPQLARAARQLSDSYRAQRGSPNQIITTEAQRAAYLSVRLPATYAAIESALLRLREYAPDFSPQTLLDLGAGPGTAALAAFEAFPCLSSATLVERDRAMIGLGHKLLANRDVHFLAQNVNTAGFPQADLVICAYALNELAQHQVDPVLRRAVAASTQCLLIIEPGSRAGFAPVLAARKLLINAPDFALVAPCPGHMPCPLAEAGDWCHFAARVQRTSQHRRLKNAALSYEDEKFSYVIGLRQPLGASPTKARIIRRPEKLKGHVELRLCTISGLQSAVITKNNGDDYKRARDAAWGDGW
ncbi:MAG: small ribosomal subunit Rsm22 family protein [Acidobacteriaceae bacterium]